MSLSSSPVSAVELIAEFHSLAVRSAYQNVYHLIDGGFYRGDFSRAILTSLSSVICTGFEPNEVLCQLWESQKSPLSRVIRLENLALGSHEHSATYFVNTSFPATNSLLPRPTQINNHSPYYPRDAHLARGQTVKVVPLDEYCYNQCISHIFLLKLDLQGGELSALRGATRLLNAGNISIIYVESVFIQKYASQPLFHELWSFLSSYGYRLHSLHDIKVGSYDSSPNLFRSSQYNQCDALFVSRDLVDILEC